MTHSYRIHFFHIIWSTKNRSPWIDKEVQSRLYPYLGGIVRKHEGKLLEIGGIADHVHLLLEMSLLDNFSDFMCALKANSSLWIHKNYPHLKDFSWQEGFSSYTVSYSLVDKVRKYIQNQEKHHSTESFDDEYIKFLNLHKVRYDQRFVLG
jgi:REP-associated tyrosine transposase